LIARPRLVSLLRFELARRGRSSWLVFGIVLFVLAALTFRVLSLLGKHDSRDGLFLLTYMAALVPVLRFMLVEDRLARFDEALTANGVSPIEYAAAKLAATGLLIAGFTAACLAASVTAGGIAPAVALRSATQALLLAWLIAPLVLAVEAIADTRTPTAVVYLFIIGAMVAAFRAGRYLELVRLIGLGGQSNEDLFRLSGVDVFVATPALLVVAWLAVARRLGPPRGD
jgi:hypothetical protein